MAIRWSRAMPRAPWVRARGPALRSTPWPRLFRTRIHTFASMQRKRWRPLVRARPRRHLPWQKRSAIPFLAFDGRREALGSIGPAAQSAVPRLIEALKDEFLYVRIFAAGALGSIGPKAQSAREALKAAANDPAMRHEAEWALNRIAGSHLVIGANERQRGSPGERAGRGAPASETVGESEGRSPSVKETSNPPIDWDPATGRNVVWSVELGNETFGRPVVAGDAVYVGTDNARRMNPAYQENAGVLVAFHAKDGKFLWQDVAPRVERGLREWLLPSTTSAPYVEGNRLYYVSAECQLRSLNTQGDIVWQLDMPALGVFPPKPATATCCPWVIC